jgi:hypothetical protein
MVWVRKTLTIGESDPQNVPGHAVGFLVAGYFAAEPPLGKRIKHVLVTASFVESRRSKRKLSLLS